MAAAKSSLHGELRWEFWVPTSEDGLLMLQLPLKLLAAGPKLMVTELAALIPVLFPAPFEFPFPGKYPPGEGRPSGPKPGLRLRRRVGGLHLCNKRRTWLEAAHRVKVAWFKLVLRYLMVLFSIETAGFSLNYQNRFCSKLFIENIEKHNLLWYANRKPEINLKMGKL